MEATHTKRLCRVRRLDRGVQARGIEVPAKESGARAKGTEVLVKVIGIDGWDTGLFTKCNFGMGQESGHVDWGETVPTHHEVNGNEYKGLTCEPFQGL